MRGAAVTACEEIQNYPPSGRSVHRGKAGVNRPGQFLPWRNKAFTLERTTASPGRPVSERSKGSCLTLAAAKVRQLPLNPRLTALYASSPGLVVSWRWPPPAGLVQHALLGQEQCLLEPAQRHSVQRLETAPAELPVGRITGRLPGNDPPSDNPAGMLDFKPGKARGWSTAHSGPPLSLAAWSRGIAARLPVRLGTPIARLAGCQRPGRLAIKASVTVSTPGTAAADGCGAWGKT